MTATKEFCDQGRCDAVKIVGVQTGKVRREGDPASRDPKKLAWSTGFYKYPVAAPLDVDSEGIAGDEVVDRKNHGGPEKAVLVYAMSHYTAWQTELPGLGMEPQRIAEFGPGALGENLTVEGVTEQEVCIGDIWAVGRSLRLQVSQPRQPCWKINRRWQISGLTKRVAETGRTGWYCRVLAAGPVGPGDVMHLTKRPHPAWSVARANDILMSRELDEYAAMELFGLPELAAAFRKALA